ncbi:MAG: hypothetical protein IIZ65_00625 [Clostridia bacterium]|nr:hypothetical protein [Clostridia bacterium]
MKHTRKLLAILLALVLALSAVCVSAFAAHKKQYQSYVFFGDSVTTGFGIQSYYDVAEEGGTAEGKRVTGAYPDLVAKGVGIDENNENYYNEAHSGWRTSELRETLDPSYNNDDGAVAKALSEGMANGKTLCDPQDPELQAKVREEIAKSDLVTIDLGSNDIQLPIIMALYASIYPQYASYFGQPEYKDWIIEDLLKKYGSENDMIVKLTEAVAKIHGIEYALEIVSKAALGGLYKFNTNYPAIIKLIHEINPNADIYVIGLYNPMSEATLSDDIPIKIGKALDPVMMSLNLYLAQLNPAKRYYTYVDAFNTSVLGTISLAAFVGSDMNLAGMGEYTINIHPNDAGHAYIAKQVLNAIPDVEDPAPAEEPTQPAQDDPAPAQPAQEDPNEGVLNGIVQGPDGKWAMYVDGVVDTGYTGIAQNKYGWWRIENGYVNFNAQSIYQNEYGWWKCTDGKVTFKEQEIYQNQYGWWKCTDSEVTFKETGIFKNKYGKWYCKNSKVDFNKNGKVKYNGKTYTVKNGKVA